MYSSCFVEDKRFSNRVLLAMLVRSYRRTCILYHKSASVRSAENVGFVRRVNAFDYATAICLLSFLPAIVEKNIPN